MSGDSVIVKEVRARRSVLSAEYDHDLRRYVDRLRKLQAQNAERVVGQLTVVRAVQPGDAKR